MYICRVLMLKIQSQKIRKNLNEHINKGTRKKNMRLDQQSLISDWCNKNKKQEQNVHKTALGKPQKKFLH